MLHQWNTVTLLDRYPDIFSYITKLDTPKSRILSFGCSTGEEIETLKKYFPESEVFGVDINQNCVSICKEKFGDSYIRHYNDFVQDKDTFDIIFCMSVLCKWEDTEKIDDCSLIYPFSQFETAIEMLDSRLNLGGYLTIYNANFCMCDTSAYLKYAPVENICESGFVHKFDRFNKKIKEEYPHALFNKIHK